MLLFFNINKFFFTTIKRKAVLTTFNLFKSSSNQFQSILEPLKARPKPVRTRLNV